MNDEAIMEVICKKEEYDLDWDIFLLNQTLADKDYDPSEFVRLMRSLRDGIGAGWWTILRKETTEEQIRIIGERIQANLQMP